MSPVICGRSCGMSSMCLTKTLLDVGLQSSPKNLMLQISDATAAFRSRMQRRSLDTGLRAPSLVEDEAVHLRNLLKDDKVELAEPTKWHRRLVGLTRYLEGCVIGLDGDVLVRKQPLPARGHQLAKRSRHWLQTQLP